MTKIIPRVPPVYRLRDYADDETEGLFYAEELQKVQKSDDIYKIEEILAEKKENGKGACKMAWIRQNNSTPGYLNQSYESLKAINTPFANDNSISSKYYMKDGV